MTQDEFNPYVGPRPFERKTEDSVRFFGRSQETEEIASLIFGHPVILVYAQSGAGKTSLFNASVALKLEESGFDVLPLTRVGGVVPKGIALQEIQNLYIFNSLLKMDSNTDPQTLLSTSLRTFLETHTRMNNEISQPCPRVIIFDQFEELFIYTPEQWREQRDGFFLQVVEALDADPLLRVVFVIREDFLAELDPYSRTLPERLRTRYRLERLGEDAALRAIKDPLVNTHRKFAPGVAEGLVKELLTMKTVDATGKTTEIEGQYVEPVQLQVVCVTLWSSLEPDCIEIQESHLQNFNVNDALSNFYKSAVESAAKETDVPEADLRNWFGKTLITPMGTRSTVFRGEDSTGGIKNNAVDFLESRHIIRAEFRAGLRWYELTHDRLVEPILASNRKWLETLSPLQRQAALWNDQRRNETWLLADQALEEVGKWAKQHQDELTATEIDFLDACRKRQAQIKLDEQARAARRLRFSLGIATMLVFIAVIATFLAIQSEIQANQARRTAENNSAIAISAKAYADQARATAQAASTLALAQQKTAEENANKALAGNLSAQANTLNNSDHALALLLGVEAFHREKSPLTTITLFDLLQYTAFRKVADFNGSVKSAAISPDGTLIAVASCKGDCSSLGELRLFDQAMSTKGSLPGKYGIIYSMAFFQYQDKLLLAAGGCDLRGCAESRGQITLWDVTDSGGSLLAQIPAHASLVKTVAFSPDGRYLASGSYDTTILLWDLKDPGRPQNLNVSMNLKSFVNDLSFSPDGNYLVAAGDDRAIYVWNVAQKNAISSEPFNKYDRVYTAPVTSVKFSPDGKTLASAGYDNLIRLWDWNAGSLSLGKGKNTLQGHTGYVTTLAFTADGFLASAGFDGQVILWDINKGEQVGPALKEHTRAVNQVVFGSFSSNGTNHPYLVSVSNDLSAIQWDLFSRNPLSPYPAYSDPENQTIVTNPDGWPQRACEAAKRNLTPEEWNTYLAGLPNTPTCPQ